MPAKQYLIGEAAEYLGVHPDTLRRWEEEGIVTPLRTKKKYRVYTQEMLDALQPK